MISAYLNVYKVCDLYITTLHGVTCRSTLNLYSVTDTLMILSTILPVIQVKLVTLIIIDINNSLSKIQLTVDCGLEVFKANTASNITSIACSIPARNRT